MAIMWISPPYRNVQMSIPARPSSTDAYCFRSSSEPLSDSSILLRVNVYNDDIRWIFEVSGVRFRLLLSLHIEWLCSFFKPVTNVDLFVAFITLIMLEVHVWTKTFFQIKLKSFEVPNTLDLFTTFSIVYHQFQITKP